MLDNINQDLRYTLLQTKDLPGGSALHLATYEGHVDIMIVIYESVTQTQWIDLLQIRGYSELSVTQRVVYYEKRSSLDMIQDSISDQQWLKVLTTPLPNLRRDKYQMAVDRIDELRTAAKVNTVLKLNTTGTVMSIPIFSRKKFKKVFAATSFRL